MTKRPEFTEAIASLLQYMINEGDIPILDFAKRSKEEQKRLFEAKLSKCDGEIKISKHQTGEAADIYLIDEGKLHDWNAGDRWDKYHTFWEESGGKPVIEWAKGHFEL